MSSRDWEDVALPGLEDLGTAGSDDRPVPATPARPVVHNDPTLEITARDVARFETKIVYSPSCWLWVGAISTPDGYGRFTWQRHQRQRTMLAHRFALLASGVSLEGDLVAEHGCNEPLCVRVDLRHVHGSTQAANLAFAASLGRLRGPHPGSSDGVFRAERSRRVREALAQGWNASAYLAAISQRDDEHPPLF